MFDALRRAEERRKMRASQAKERPPLLEKVEGVVQPSASRPDIDGFPSSFLRELGMLRNSIDSTLRGKEKKTLLFASATRKEGTTTVGTSYARMLAFQGAGRVLLCEMNARNPSFRQIFKLDGRAGITDFFLGERDLASIAHQAAGGNLNVIHVGREDPAIIQLHLQSVFPRLIQAAAEAYNTVIFDAPPIISSPETPPMTAHVDGVVIVVHAGKTKREILQRSLGAIAQFEGNVLGVILNRKRYYIPEFLYKRI